MRGSGNPADPKFLGPTITRFIEHGKNKIKICFPDSKFPVSKSRVILRCEVVIHEIFIIELQ